MFELHRGYWGSIPGDGFKLISTVKLSEHETREEAWKAFHSYPQDEQFELLVQKPDWSNCSRGYPTRWDEPYAA